MDLQANMSPSELVNDQDRHEHKQGDGLGLKASENTETTKSSISPTVDQTRRKRIDPLPQSPSPLLTLPQELRNEMYAHLCADFEIHPTYLGAGVFETWAGLPGHDSKASTFQSVLAITRVCQQLRAETYVFPWRLGTYPMRRPDLFADWLDRVKEEIREAVWGRLSKRSRIAVQMRAKYWTEVETLSGEDGDEDWETSDWESSDEA